MSQIDERTLAELLFPHVLDDPITFHRLTQVSKKFNKVSKTKLRRKELENYFGEKRVWTELPTGGLKHGLSRGWCGKYVHDIGYVQGSLIYSHNHHHGELHGTQHGWDNNGKLCYIHNYRHGASHGRQQGWSQGGILEYDCVIEK